MEEPRKKQIEADLRAEFEATLADRTRRFLEIGHQGIVANQHFVAASAECILSYRDGHFVATVMMSHGINEAIVRLVAERNSIALATATGAKTLDVVIEELEQAGKFSGKCAAASKGIYDSFRNDVHHMSLKVISINFASLALKNVQRLAAIEREIFAFELEGGAIRPKNPQYWDPGPEGYASAFLRLGL